MQASFLGALIWEVSGYADSLQSKKELNAGEEAILKLQQR